MAPGRKPAIRPSTRRQPAEAPMTSYELQRMEICMRNSGVFRSMRKIEVTEILRKSGPNAIKKPKTINASREDSSSLYHPEDSEDVEQGVVDKDLEPEVNKISAHSVCVSTAGPRTSKRVMAMALQEQDRPPRITRQRTRELMSTPEGTTVDPQDDSTAGLMAANANTETNNQNELSTEDRSGNQCRISTNIGRDLDNISRVLPDNIPVHITEGKLRHFNDKVSGQFIINMEANPVKEAFSDLLKKEQRQMRYMLRKQYFDGILRSLFGSKFASLDAE